MIPGTIPALEAKPSSKAARAEQSPRNGLGPPSAQVHVNVRKMASRNAMAERLCVQINSNYLKLKGGLSLSRDRSPG